MSRIPCSLCTKTFGTPAAYCQHVRDAHTCMFVCAQCGSQKGSAHAACQHLRSTGHCRPFPTAVGEWQMTKTYTGPETQSTWGMFFCPRCGYYWISPGAYSLHYQWCGRCLMTASPPSLLWKNEAA